MAGERALVLVPCSERKESRSSKIEPQSPITEILTLRERMVEFVGDITMGPAVPAVSLYNGALYNQCQGSMEAVASGRHPGIDLLIVSAYYGLVHPAEPIAGYNLHMGNEVGGVKVYRLWQQLGVGTVLEDYVRRQEITHVWSLLASQYQKALNPFWRNLKGKVDCWQVIVPGGGQSNPYRRGEWLEQVLMTSPYHLLESDPAPESIAPPGGWTASGKRSIEYRQI